MGLVQTRKAKSSRVKINESTLLRIEERLERERQSLSRKEIGNHTKEAYYTFIKYPEMKPDVFYRNSRCEIMTLMWLKRKIKEKLSKEVNYEN